MPAYASTVIKFYILNSSDTNITYTLNNIINLSPKIQRKKMLF